MTHAPMIESTMVEWQEAGLQKSAQWRSEAGVAPPKRVIWADDSMNAELPHRNYGFDFQDSTHALPSHASAIGRGAKHHDAAVHGISTSAHGSWCRDGIRSRCVAAGVRNAPGANRWHSSSSLRGCRADRRGAPPSGRTITTRTRRTRRVEASIWSLRHRCPRWNWPSTVAPAPARLRCWRGKPSMWWRRPDARALACAQENIVRLGLRSGSR